MARKKNATGRGSVYKDERGKWHAWFSPGNGAKRIHREAKTQAEVLAKLKELEKRRDSGINLGRAPTVTQWLKTWLELIKKAELKPNVYDGYEQDCRLYVEPYVGTVRLDQLTANHVRQMLRAMEEKKLSPYTAKKGYARLSAALDAAVRDNLIPYNIIRKGEVKAPRTGDGEEALHALTDHQVDTLLSTLAGHRLYALFLLAVRTGVREGELLGLRWVDVKWDAREIHITGQLQYQRKRGDTPGALIRTTPKTKRSRRIIPVGPRLIAALKEHQRNQQEERTIRSRQGKWKESGLVFVTDEGTPIRASNLVRTFDGILKKAKLPDIRFHDLRHTAASLMLAAGEPLPNVSAILGHADTAITARTYSHSYHEGQRNTMERMEERQHQREELDR